MNGFRFERICRTPHSEAYLVVEDEEVVARVDLHFTLSVVYGILVVERELDDAAIEALGREDEDELDGKLEEMWQLVKAEGEELPVEDLSPSDVIIPPSDLTLDETRMLFAGEGLIPDLPTA